MSDLATAGSDETMKEAQRKEILAYHQKKDWRLPIIKEVQAAYIQKVKDEKFAGHNDWRLPTLEEAMSLIERNKNEAGLYIASIFDKTQTEIWTSDKSDASRAWVVDFNYGGCDTDRNNDLVFVRGVR